MDGYGVVAPDGLGVIVAAASMASGSKPRVSFENAACLLLYSDRPPSSVCTSDD